MNAAQKFLRSMNNVLAELRNVARGIVYLEAQNKALKQELADEKSGNADLEKILAQVDQWRRDNVFHEYDEYTNEHLANCSGCLLENILRGDEI